MMRHTTLILVAVAICAATTALPAQSGQKTKKKTSSLERMLQKALADNPEIRVAQAEVLRAEARLNRVRLDVTRQVVQRHFEKRAAADRLHAAVTKAESGRVPNDVLLGLRAEIERIQSEIDYLSGGRVRRVKLDDVTNEGRGSIDADAATRKKKQDSFWLKSKLLHNKVSVRFKDVSLNDAIASLFKQADSTFKIVFKSRAGVELCQRAKVTLWLGRTTLETGLQALADVQPIAFVFRKYGVLVVTKNEAGGYPGSHMIR